MSERHGKYNARPVTINGIRFDSAAESRRYQELLLLQAAGEIQDLTVHPAFEILPAFTRNGQNHRPTRYEADFTYTDPGGCQVVEDVKGGRATQTAVFRLKAKMFEYRYPHIELRIVEM